MGMFDSVRFICPNCGESIEFQSKAGECLLHDYSPTDVPGNIAQDIEGDMEHCPKCKKIYIAFSYTPITRVAMGLK